MAIPPTAGADLLGRLLVALVTGRWPSRQQRNTARRALDGVGADHGGQVLVLVPKPTVAKCERPFSPSTLFRWGTRLAAGHSECGSSAGASGFIRALSVAACWLSGFSRLSVGCVATGSGFHRDLFCTLAAQAARQRGRTVACRRVAAAMDTVSLDVPIGLREVVEWRSDLAQFECFAVPLRDTASADVGWLVGPSTSAVVRDCLSS